MPFRRLVLLPTLLLSALAGEGMDLEEIRESIDLVASRERLAGDDAAALRFFDSVQDEAIERTFAEVAGGE